MGAFADDLGSWFDMTTEQLHKVVIYSVLELQTRIKIRTPVDTGRLRANWIYSYGKPSTSVVAVTGGQARGFAGAEVGLSGSAMGGVHYIINNLPYARRIELGFVGPDRLGRNYNQTGRKMVGLTVLEWDQIIRKAAQAVRSLP